MEGVARWELDYKGKPSICYRCYQPGHWKRQCKNPSVPISALLAHPDLSEGGVKGSYAQVVKSRHTMEVLEKKKKEQDMKQIVKAEDLESKMNEQENGENVEYSTQFVLPVKEKKVCDLMEDYIFIGEKENETRKDSNIKNITGDEVIEIRKNSSIMVEEDRKFDVNMVIKQLENISKTSLLWRESAKTVDGKKVKERKCKLCEENKEDYTYVYDAESKMNETKDVLDSLAALLMELKKGHRKPWKERCDLNVRDDLHRERKLAMEDHGLLVNYKEVLIKKTRCNKMLTP